MQLKIKLHSFEQKQGIKLVIDVTDWLLLIGLFFPIPTINYTYMYLTVTRAARDNNYIMKISV